MKTKTTVGMREARQRSKDRITAAHVDREAASRYRELADRNPSQREDFLARAAECDRLSSYKMKSAMAAK